MNNTHECSRWPQAHRQQHAERGVDLLGQGLEELRDKLNAKFFLYESTGDLESLLVAVSSFVKVGRLLDDIDAGRRMSINELRKAFPTTEGRKKRKM